MQYTVTRGEKGKAEIKVDIPKIVFGETYEKVLGELGKDTRIAGFRPGKIPKDVVENHVGTNKILNEAASFLISKHLSGIFKKENISPLGNPSVAVHSLVKDAPFSFTATVISKPKVKVGDWKKIKVKKVKAREVTEKDVNESIKNIYEAWRRQNKSDTQQATSDTKEEEDDQKSGKFIYDARGNKVFFDEKKTLRSSSNQDSTAGLKISQDEQSKPDDEFAKKIGARDLSHLKEIVKKDLEQIVADQVEAKLEEEIFDEVLKISEVEVPDILVDDEVNRIMIRLNQSLEQQDRKLDDYLREQNTTLEALRAKFRPQAEKNVKVTLIMDEIGKSEKVQVGREEIDNALKNINQADLKEDQKKDLEQYLAVSLLQAKTLEYVKKTVAS